MVTEVGLYQLGLSCLMLEEIDLTDCSGMNDIGKIIEVLSVYRISVLYNIADGSD
jgi:hypothetical protein